MAKKKPSFSTVVSFMSEETQNRLREEQMETSLTLPLESIRPDPEQPRQLLDEGLITAVLRGELLPATAIQQWLGQGDNPLTPRGIKENIELFNTIDHWAHRLQPNSRSTPTAMLGHYWGAKLSLL